jgi:hypothetical protein
MRAMPVVAVAASLEVLTASLLLVTPVVLARLVLGAELSGGGADPRPPRRHIAAGAPIQ